MDRRQFIQTGISGTAAMTLTGFWKAYTVESAPQSVFPKRKLGKTGEMLSIIGFGGIVVRNETSASAANLVASAYDRGINYFDVAPSYGNAQERLGPALKPYRKKCFLACKTQKRDKAGAEAELNESLRLLKTDHVDLYQLHAMATEEDVEKAFGPGGAFEVFLKAKKEGKTRFLGFSAHSEKAALSAMDRFDFDTVLMPINFVCWHQGNFGPAVVKKAAEKNMGILALKSLAFTVIKKGEAKPYAKLWYKPIEDDAMADLSVRFTLSQGTTAAIPPGDSKFFEKAFKIAKTFKPLTPQEMETLKKISQGVEPLFKST